MSPRVGGEAAKFGARFEGRWTARYLLEVLLGRVDAITVEPVDSLGDHVEFFVDRGGEIEGHQAKRQVGGRTNWTLHRLDGEGVLTAAKAYVDSGRRYSFVSTVPAEPLAALADAGRRAADYPAFSALIAGNNTLRAGFDVLAEKWGGPLEAWGVLHRLDVWKPDERHLHQTNVAIGALVFDGESDGAVSVLADIAEDHTGVPLTADRLWDELEARGIRPNALWDSGTLAELVAQQTTRYLRDAKGRLFDPPIPRSETAAIHAALADGAPLVVVAGAAGGGKSAVVAAVVDDAIADGSAVLALRLDSFMEVRSSRQLGTAVDLPASPAVALARAAAGRRAVLVVDQLDAVSLASGRSPEVFAVVEELLGEASRLGVRVVLACRRYDIDNDPRLKALVETRGARGPVVVEVAPLTDEQVAGALTAMAIQPAVVGRTQLDLLRLPLNLALLQVVAGDSDALTFTTTRDLLALYWKMKHRAAVARRADVRFDRVVEVLVDAMSARQTLALPEQILDAEGLDDDVEVLASEHLIVRANGRVSFFHETLFDYAFARRWVARGESVLEFLLAGEQELFRRAQVRQVLLYLRDYDAQLFVAEVRDVLNQPRVRYHVKESVFFILRGLVNPSQAEVQLMLELLASESPWQSRAELAVRSSAWVGALDRAGVINGWLASGDTDLEGRAVTIVGNAGDERAGRAAELLSAHRTHPDFRLWLKWVVRFVDVDRDRALFDLLLGAVQEGAFDEDEQELFMLTHSLGERAPEWAVELLAAWFAERPAAFEELSGHVKALKSSDHGLNELIAKAAEGAPEAFVRRLLPYMQRVMSEAEHGDELPRSDWHFSSMFWGSDRHQADDNLMQFMTGALRAVAGADPELVRKHVEPLVDDVHAAAQDLLYEALTGAGAAHADWAAELLLRGGAALRAGYSDSPYWRTRELLRATAEHMSDVNFAAVEALVAQFEPEWERTHPPSRGDAAFVLLSGLPEERLSNAPRRRLGELRRKFGSDEPEPPRGIVGGFVGPPIPEERAEHMTDEQWRGAMRKHASDEGDWRTFELRGGAYELGHVLKAATEREAERFAGIALTIDGSFNRHYLEAILMGLGDTQVGVEPGLVFDVIRHAASVGDQDRWIAQPLKRMDDEEIPRDIVEIVLARALGRSALEEGQQTDDATEDAHDMGDSFTSGLNTSRGGNVYALARLVAFDRDGRRTAIVIPYLRELANDPSPEVRACAAELIRFALRWDRNEAIASFTTLARDRAPALVKANAFGSLMFAVIVADVDAALPVADDMLASADGEMRDHGARFLALGAIEGGRAELLERVVESEDPAVRRGAALILAARIRWADDPELLDRLARMFDDDDEEVRKAAATVAGNVRGEPLARYRALLAVFIASPAADDPTQLLLTLEHAPEPEHDLTLQLAHRIVDTEGQELGDIRTGAAGDARYLTQLLLRSYSLVSDAAMRAQLLDVIDRLLEVNAYGIADAIDEVGR